MAVKAYKTRQLTCMAVSPHLSVTMLGFTKCLSLHVFYPCIFETWLYCQFGHALSCNGVCLDDQIKFMLINIHH